MTVELELQTWHLVVMSVIGWIIMSIITVPISEKADNKIYKPGQGYGFACFLFWPILLLFASIFGLGYGLDYIVISAAHKLTGKKN